MPNHLKKVYILNKTPEGGYSIVPVKDILHDPFFVRNYAPSGTFDLNQLFLSGYHCVEYADMYVLFKSKAPIDFVNKERAL